MTIQQFLKKARRIIVPHNYVGLLASLVLVIVVAPLLSTSAFGNEILNFFVVIMLLIASIAVSRNKGEVWIPLVLGVTTSVVWMLSFATNGETFWPKYLLVFGHSVTILFMVVVACLIARHVFSGEVNGNRICGAVCVYVLVGLCSALIYIMIMHLDPFAFRLNGVLTNAALLARADRFSMAIYYSFCTISTLGFGDVTPVNKFARSLSWLEAVFGQFYLTILVARLVGLHIAAKVEKQSRRKTRPGQSPG